MNLQNHKKWLFLITLIITTSYSNAETFCVSTSAQLISTLITAQNNGEADEIRLKTNIYIAPFQQSFNYIAPDTETFGLNITGGWTGVGFTCVNQPGYALNTVIDGNFGNRVFNISPKGSQTIQITGLTFINGEISGENGGGLNIIAPTSGGFIPVGFDGTIIVENNAFISNQAGSASALNIEGANTIIVRNNLILDNHATISNAVYLDNRSEIGIYFTNNTVMGNTTDSISSAAAAVSIYTSGSSQGFIANNILWGNYNGQALDLRFDSFEGSGNFYLYNNDIGSYIGFSLNEANNISATPEFQAGIDNYTPQYNGNLYNQGIEPPVFFPTPIPFNLDWYEGDEDFTAMNRIMNGLIDIGAIETVSDVIFEDGFE